jgi:Holliday junction DNA helicase RuvB
MFYVPKIDGISINFSKYNSEKHLTIKIKGTIVNSEKENILRPKNLSAYVGQQAIRSQLEVYIKAAKIKKKALAHTLYFGEPGLGKTSISKIMATEMGSNIHIILGPSIKKLHEVVAPLVALEKGDFLFIDEIHRMRQELQEILYTAMEDFRIDIIVNDKTVTIDLPEFTLVGATTKQGDLTGPLRDRFVNQFKLESYSLEELKEIIRNSTKILENTITSEATEEIAIRSKGIPRVANNYLLKINDYSIVQKDEGGDLRIDEALAKSVFKELGVDEYGMSEYEKKILDAMYNIFELKPVGINALVSATGVEKNDIETYIEPHFIKKGLIRRSPRGRILTDLGKSYCQNNLK